MAEKESTQVGSGERGGGEGGGDHRVKEPIQYFCREEDASKQASGRGWSVGRLVGQGLGLGPVIAGHSIKDARFLYLNNLKL